jgi:hypothetical protein
MDILLRERVLYYVSILMGLFAFGLFMYALYYLLQILSSGPKNYLEIVLPLFPYLLIASFLLAFSSVISSIRNRVESEAYERVFGIVEAYDNIILKELTEKLDYGSDATVSKLIAKTNAKYLYEKGMKIKIDPESQKVSLISDTLSKIPQPSARLTSTVVRTSGVESQTSSRESPEPQERKEDVTENKEPIEEERELATYVLKLDELKQKGLISDKTYEKLIKEYKKQNK